MSLAWCEHYLCFQIQKKFQINQTTWDSNKKYMLLHPKQGSSEKAKNDHFGQKVNDDPISISWPRLKQWRWTLVKHSIIKYFTFFRTFFNLKISVVEAHISLSCLKRLVLQNEFQSKFKTKFYSPRALLRAFSFWIFFSLCIPKSFSYEKYKNISFPNTFKMIVLINCFHLYRLCSVENTQL